MFPAIIIRREKERVTKSESKQSYLNTLSSACIQWMLNVCLCK